MAAKPAWAVSVVGVDTPTSGSVGRAFGSSGLVLASAGVVMSVLRRIRADSQYASRFRSVRMVCVHTVRRVQSPSRTACDRRPVIISIKYAAHCHGMHLPLFVNY